MASLTTLRTNCGLRFHDPDNDVVPAATWTYYLNEAYHEANAYSPLWPWLEGAEATISVTASTRSGNLPSDTFQVNWVYNVTDDYPLVPQEGRGDQWRGEHLRSDVGAPLTYRLRGSTIEVFPMPEATTSLRVECVTWPAALSADGDVPAFPLPFHTTVLVPGALSRAYLDDGNEKHYRLQRESFLGALQHMQDSILSFRTERNVPIRDAFFG